MTPTNPAAARTRAGCQPHAALRREPRVCSALGGAPWRAASAAAHHSRDEAAAAGPATTGRGRTQRRLVNSPEALLMAELWGWEAGLLHAAQTPPEDVPDLLARHAWHPADLPFPALARCPVSPSRTSHRAHPVAVTGDTLVIHDLTVTHGEAAAFVRSQMSTTARSGRRSRATCSPRRPRRPVDGDRRRSNRLPHPDPRHVRRRWTPSPKRPWRASTRRLTRLKAGEEASPDRQLGPREAARPGRGRLAGQAGNVRASVIEAARRSRRPDPGAHHGAGPPLRVGP